MLFSGQTVHRIQFLYNRAYLGIVLSYEKGFYDMGVACKLSLPRPFFWKITYSSKKGMATLIFTPRPCPFRFTILGALGIKVKKGSLWSCEPFGQKIAFCNIVLLGVYFWLKITVHYSHHLTLHTLLYIMLCYVTLHWTVVEQIPKNPSSNLHVFDLAHLLKLTN